jgi:hypothetical protein
MSKSEWRPWTKEHIYTHDNESWESVEYRKRNWKISYKLYHIDHIKPVWKNQLGIKISTEPLRVKTLCLNGIRRSKEWDACGCQVPKDVMKKHQELIKLKELADKLK